MCRLHKSRVLNATGRHKDREDRYRREIRNQFFTVTSKLPL